MIPETEPEERELRDYLAIFRRRLSVILLTIGIIVGVTLVVSFVQRPVYQATAKVLLDTRQKAPLFDPNTGQLNDPDRAVQTEIEVLKSEPVREAVVRTHGSVPSVSAAPIGKTDVIEVHVNDREPKRAADLVNAYVREYISFRRKTAVDNLVAAVQGIQPTIAALQKQIDDLAGQISDAPAAQRPVLEQNLGPRRDALISQQAVFKQKLDQLQVEAAVSTGGAQVVKPATTPTSKFSPKPKKNVALALIASLLLGGSLAWLVDYLDDSIKTKEDLERASSGLAALGFIPALADWKVRGETHVIAREEPASAPAEAYRALRTSIQFLGLDRPIRTLQVTSSSAAEGKTTTIANLAVALARAGQRVIVVCCDLRRPRLNEFFQLPNAAGFTSVLLGDVPLSEALQPVPGEPRILLLSSGPLPPNPSELLSSKRAVELVTALQANADIVLFDSPPVLPVTDAAVLAARVDATLLVVLAGGTTRKELSRAVELLRHVDAPLVGAVLNGVTNEAGIGHQYEYYYRQEERPGSSRVSEA